MDTIDEGMEKALLGLMQAVDLEQQDLRTQEAYLTLETLAQIHKLRQVQLMIHDQSMSLGWVDPNGIQCHIQIHAGLPMGPNGELLFRLFQPGGLPANNQQLIWNDIDFTRAGVYCWQIEPAVEDQSQCRLYYFHYPSEVDDPGFNPFLIISEMFYTLDESCLSQDIQADS